MSTPYPLPEEIVIEAPPEEPPPEGLATEGETAIVLQEEEAPTDLLTPQEAEGVCLGFLSSEGMGEAFHVNGWNVGEEVRILSSIARDDGEETRMRVLAMEVLEKRRMAALRYSGRLATLVSKKVEETEGDETRTTITNELRQVVRKVQRGLETP